ncbi:hypothetical protein [Oleiharenicola lentus]|uniref:hypothetical protein n=1 Tax=Oleiharenicola lentus TaxID=2508720 RepID=UPI003F668809
METWLIGSWRSVESNIPDYHPGCERLIISPEGAQVFEITHSDGGKPRRYKIQLNGHGADYSITWWKQDSGEPHFTVPLKIQRVSENEIMLTPAVHGHVTKFRREPFA